MTDDELAAIEARAEAMHVGFGECVPHEVVRAQVDIRALLADVRRLRTLKECGAAAATIALALAEAADRGRDELRAENERLRAEVEELSHRSDAGGCAARGHCPHDVTDLECRECGWIPDREWWDWAIASKALEGK